MTSLSTMEFARVRQGPFKGRLVRYDYCIGQPSLTVRPMRHHKLGLTYTASGYGKAIPTEYMVRTINQKWRRVYCTVYSNIGTCWIVQDGEKIIVDITLRG